MGKAPSSGPRKTTRKMLETDIELPTREELNPWRKPTSQAQPASEQTQVAQSAPALEPVAPLTPPPAYEEPGWEEPAPSRSTKEGGSAAYTVQKGDTLQKIASKFYGTSKPWRKIYEANQASLKSPDSIYPGQKLVIPPADADIEEPRSDYK
ncbi:MAG: LysM peptidoglycan-binding domain-containing protein [Candidatus Omnitrophica bacterium]|nr:LysM peptidoglycan-binding domain-containing protein [Candidatus Omnitrophota bacterium]